MGAQISFLDGPHASSSLEDMPGYFEPFPDHEKGAEVPSILEGADNTNISGGTFVAAGRDVTTTTVNNIVINLVDSEPLMDNAILNWLSAINYRTLQMANLEKAIAGTHRFFFRRFPFRQWLRLRGAILWGIGMPGAGKTILACMVIDYLEKYARDHGPRIALVYAYCRYTEPVPIQQILAALVRQLLERCPFVYPLVKPIYDEHCREMTKPSKAQLLQLLSDMCQIFHSLFCVIDGLDEAAPDIQFDLLNALSSVKANFFFTSRPLDPLPSVLPEARFFKVAASDEDIGRLIREKLYKDPRICTVLNGLGRVEKYRQIEGPIKKAASGMFLHAALQVEALQHATNLRHALDSLQQVPPNLHELYAQTMERINARPGEQPRLARRILTWVAYARPGLTLNDLRYALAIQLCHPLPASGDIFDPMALIDEALLLSMCHGLVVVERSSARPAVPRLIHFTARDYLRQIIPPLEAHLLLSTTCVRRIISSTVPSHHLNPQGTFERCPLLDYALNSWVEHGNECIDAKGVITDALRRDITALFARRPSFVAREPSQDPWREYNTICTVSPQLQRRRSHEWTSSMLAAKSGHP